MVIYVLGLVGFILMKAETLSDQSKEQFRFEIYLREGIKNIDIMQLKKKLDAEDFVVKTVFKDKDDALSEFHAKVNAEENFLMTLGKNPLPQNIDVFFTAAYTHPDSIKVFQKKFINHPIISDFRYPSDLLYLVHSNVKKISMILLILGSLLLLVAIALINNTIRLRVYAQRFLIRTMQLIGANKTYIKRPFLRQAMVLGFVSGCLSIISLAGSLHLLYGFWPEVANELIDITQDIKLYISMAVGGMIITWASTLFAVSRFLRLKTEKLYY